MKLPFDFGGVESKFMGNNLPEGTWECRAKSVEWRRSAQKGTLYLNILWECVEDGDYKGGKTFEKRYLTENTVPYFKGWSERVMNVALPNMQLNEQLYVGRFATVKITEEEREYQGEVKKRYDADSFVSDAYGHMNKPVEGSYGASTQSWESVSSDEFGGGSGASAGGGNGYASVGYESDENRNDEMDDLPF